MSYTISIHEAAMEEYKSAIVWYRQHSGKAATGFAAEIEDKLNILRRMPGHYRKTYQSYREIRLKKYPYSIIYEVNESLMQVSIISICHRKRDPDKKYVR